LSDLIDTTEMYLRTIYELQEEGVVPLRARIAERLGQSGPTVSETVARMGRDGLLVVAEDRTVEFTVLGRQKAIRVMRKHRLAERLLADIIGLDWEAVHEEACRWEHVISEQAERRLLQVLGHPTQSPFGNPIPGLAELDPAAAPAETATVRALAAAAGREPSQLVVASIAEQFQGLTEMMARLDQAGIRPGSTVTAAKAENGAVSLATEQGTVHVPAELAGYLTILA
jgi:DtxR family Mn-dependent transcriptional regulator